MSLFDALRRALGGESSSGQPSLSFGFRGEDIVYCEDGREIEIGFTWVNGDRLYTDSVDRWRDGTSLSDAEKERVFVQVLRFVKGRFTKPLIVINTDDPSRALWEQVCAAQRGVIKGVEYTSGAEQMQIERETYLQIIQSGKKLVIDGKEIGDAGALDEYLAGRGRRPPEADDQR